MPATTNTIYFTLNDLVPEVVFYILRQTGWESAVEYEMQHKAVWKLVFDSSKIHSDVNHEGVPNVDEEEVFPIRLHHFKTDFFYNQTFYKETGHKLLERIFQDTGNNVVYINIVVNDPDWEESSESDDESEVSDSDDESEVSDSDDESEVSDSDDEAEVSESDDESEVSESDESEVSESDDEPIVPRKLHGQIKRFVASPSPSPEPNCDEDYFVKKIAAARERGDLWLDGWNFWMNPKTKNSYVLAPAQPGDALNWNIPLRWDIGMKHPIFYQERFGGWLVSLRHRAMLDKSGAKEIKM